MSIQHRIDGKMALCAIAAQLTKDAWALNVRYDDEFRAEAQCALRTAYQNMLTLAEDIGVTLEDSTPTRKDHHATAEDRSDE